MAYITNLNLGNGTTSTHKLTVPEVLFDKHVELKRTAGEAVYGNIDTPADAQRKVRFAFSNIANVYRGSGVDPGFQYTSKRGISAVCQSTFVATTTDDTDTDVRIDWPVSIHTVLRMPVTAFLTSENVYQFLTSHVADLLQNAGASDTAVTDHWYARMEAWRRGYLGLGYNG